MGTEVDPCACIGNQGLPSDASSPYASHEGISEYGNYCAAWDSTSASPWFEDSCNPPSEDCNWCSGEWCFVSAECESAYPTEVFEGAFDLYYSYTACGNADCYNGPMDGEGCPYESCETTTGATTTEASEASEYSVSEYSEYSVSEYSEA